MDIPEKEQSWKWVDVPYDLKSFFKGRTMDLVFQKKWCKYPLTEHNKEWLDDSWNPYVLAVYMCYKVPVLVSPDITWFFSQYQV